MLVTSTAPRACGSYVGSAVTTTTWPAACSTATWRHAVVGGDLRRRRAGRRRCLAGREVAVPVGVGSAAQPVDLVPPAGDGDLEAGPRAAVLPAVGRAQGVEPAAEGRRLLGVELAVVGLQVEAVGVEVLGEHVVVVAQHPVHPDLGVWVGGTVGVAVGVAVGRRGRGRGRGRRWASSVGVVVGVTVELGASVGSEPWVPVGSSCGPVLVPSCVVVPPVAVPFVAFLAGASPPSVCWLPGSPARSTTFWLAAVRRPVADLPTRCRHRCRRTACCSASRAACSAAR